MKPAPPCNRITPPPPEVLNSYKSSSCVTILALLWLGVCGLYLFGNYAYAQILPPTSVRKWQGTGDGSWGTATRWSGGIPNDNNHHALFGNEATPGGTTPEIEVQVGGERRLKSLWFDAGNWYTLKETGPIRINQGEKTGADSFLVVVNSDGTRQSEINIDSNIKFESVPSPGHIRNYAEGGLRFGGAFMLADNYIRISGTGATHIAGKITGNELHQNSNGNIEVSGNGLHGEKPHLILSGENPNWGGFLHAYRGGFAIIKADQALGGQSEKHARFGGTISFRSHLETPLTYQKPDQNNIIQAWELGIVRRDGLQQIGAIYNDGGYNILGMRISLTSTPAGQSDTMPQGTDLVGFGSRGDRGGGLELTNVINGTGTFVKLGPGLIVLKNSNSWNKDTIIRAGVLRLGAATAIPTDTNLVFEGGIHGGILELGDSDFTRNLGTANGQMRWVGSGGFSAHGGDRSVTIDGGTALTWGSTADFLGDGHALLLSSRYADSIITFKNAIDLNGAQREVRVDRGDFRAGIAAHGVLDGVLSGTGGLRKTGRGLLHLTQANTYSGATVIEGGALRGNLSGDSNLVLKGGVFGIDSNFSAHLGSGGWQIRWEGSGGFAAYGGGNHILQFGGNSDPVTWGDSHFVQNGAELRFGHYSANGTVVWHQDKKFYFGDGIRTIRVERAEANKAGKRADFRFAGELVSTKETTIYLVGDGLIDFIHANHSLHAKNIMVYGAQLRLHGPGRVAASAQDNEAPDYFLRHGGTLTLDNNQESSHSDRIQNESTITLSGGTLEFIGKSTSQIFEQLGAVVVDLGANVMKVTSFEWQKAQLHIKELMRATDSLGTLDLELGTDGITELRLTNSASGLEEGGIIPWATANGKDWLISNQVSNDHFLVALAASSYETGGQSGWSTAHNVNTAGDTLTGDRTINSLVLGGDLGLGSHQLRLNSGGLLSTGGDWEVSGSGTITGGIRPLYVHTSGNLTFSDTARLTGGMDIVKTLGGTLRFNNSSSTTHSIGDLYIHQGTVEVGRNSRLSVRDRVTIGDGAGTDRLILPGGVWYPIVKEGGGLPSITLRGTPYDPRGPELQLGGNGGSDGKTYGAGTKLRLDTLHIENRGTIDFRGGEVGLANIIWLDDLTFNDANARLFIRNWYEYEDVLLVKRSWDLTRLPQIVFEGYQDYETTWRDYDKDYIQITPFGNDGLIPEPSTYGAIVAAISLGVIAWKKKRRTAKESPPNKTA